ncbi:adenine-specific methyltransferase EcoRI family protein [Endomicrobium proavitum]|uniref:Modification methylase EcoRI n=1 Tax=Endomicrobium proavitum TaxID=1408281 RepID=A0A0G3WJH3_9BACT|nr:adenine-specific methyltransferase EcoRI family protein [Endomicrobium proavitum]AKL98007.1 Modification methylase EcoRI [Endomicrobium proavitum]
MASKNLNSNLHNAKNAKNDEFYTQLSDIEKELKHYKGQFKDKVVLCNCDDPRVSNFFHFFSYNFEKFKLKKLIAICYKNQDMDLFSKNNSEKAIYLEYYGDKNGNNVPDPLEIGIKCLKGDGDFRSEECIELLKQADIVVTNPPFSLFREYVAQLVEYNKKFLIIGNNNSISYKEIFKLIKENKVWLGYNCVRWFNTNNGLAEGARSFWFTNLDTTKRHEDLILYKRYNTTDYPNYDNYDAIEVSKTANIPVDYSGVMGVPITFLDKYNPEQFEIIQLDHWGILGNLDNVVNGKTLYRRIYIRNKRIGAS